MAARPENSSTQLTIFSADQARGVRWQDDASAVQDRLGIAITMYFNDHEPPHFHVRYAEHRATFAIDALGLLAGQLPPRVLGLVAEWAALHRFELRRNWTLLATEGKVRRRL